MTNSRPPVGRRRTFRRSKQKPDLSPPQERRVAERHRELLRRYRAIASAGKRPAGEWRRAVFEALAYLGGDADRTSKSLRDYDHNRYGPFLGVSDDGDAADDICGAAMESPKAQALGRAATPLNVGVGVDGERLGGVGEVPVGPIEFADIWSKCAGRSLTTTNVGARANIRNYLSAPLVKIDGGEAKAALTSARARLGDAFGPFLITPDKKPRPLIVFVEFEFGSKRSDAERRTMLRTLVEHTKSGGIAAPRVHRLGLNVRIGWGPKGLATAFKAIELARSVGIKEVSVDGVVRKEADRAISFSGLTNYLAPELVTELLAQAKRKGVRVRPLKQVDPDTVARSIWSTLNTARGMNFHLGKYGLVPLTLEESEIVVRQVQRWFPHWSAAPVFYVDQGVVSDDGIYVSRDMVKGIRVWLRAMAKHGVKIVLIDTVDKAQGWKILRTGNDPKGLLTTWEIAQLAALGEKLGIKVLWAGGITAPQAYDFGKLGVFGIYVTTAAAATVAVDGKYRRDPALPKRKRPTFGGVLKVKTLLEAGYLARQAANEISIMRALNGGSGPVNILSEADQKAFAKILPTMWHRWWRQSR